MGTASQISRRGLITGLISLVAAPAIVRAGSLMPVKLMLPEEPIAWITGAMPPVWSYAHIRSPIVQNWSVGDVISWGANGMRWRVTELSDYGRGAVVAALPLRENL